MSAFDVDAIIDRLLEVRGSKPGKPVQLTESEIRELCYRSREIFISQPILLELEAPIKICGKSKFQFLEFHELHLNSSRNSGANFLQCNLMKEV